jgi:hypothetical protein
VTASAPAPRRGASRPTAGTAAATRPATTTGAASPTRPFSRASYLVLLRQCSFALCNVIIQTCLLPLGPSLGFPSGPLAGFFFVHIHRGGGGGYGGGGGGYGGGGGGGRGGGWKPGDWEVNKHTKITVSLVALFWSFLRPSARRSRAGASPLFSRLTALPFLPHLTPTVQRLQVPQLCEPVRLLQVPGERGRVGRVVPLRLVVGRTSQPFKRIQFSPLNDPSLVSYPAGPPRGRRLWCRRRRRRRLRPRPL